MRHLFGFGHGNPSNDDHKLALELAIAELTGPQMMEIRQRARELELPFDDLLGFYHSQLDAVGRERRAGEMKSAITELEIRSTGKDYRPVKINPGEIYEVTTRPQYAAFRPERLEIPNNTSLWTIKSFRIGNREQFKNDVPGSAFNEYVKEGVIGPFETAQTAMDVTLLVQLSTEAPEPLMFEGKFYGLGVGY
jgi:hypothetical protein